MTKTLFILNDPPYGTERSYNALRLAGSLARRPGEEVKVFLMGDAASCAKANQKVPQGYYNVELMLQGPASRHGVEIGVVRHLHGCPRDLRRRARRRDQARLPQPADGLDRLGRQDAGVLSHGRRDTHLPRPQRHDTGPAGGRGRDAAVPAGAFRQSVEQPRLRPAAQERSHGPGARWQGCSAATRTRSSSPRAAPRRTTSRSGRVRGARRSPSRRDDGHRASGDGASLCMAGAARLALDADRCRRRWPGARGRGARRDRRRYSARDGDALEQRDRRAAADRGIHAARTRGRRDHAHRCRAVGRQGAGRMCANSASTCSPSPATSCTRPKVSVRSTFGAGRRSFHSCSGRATRGDCGPVPKTSRPSSDSAWRARSRAATWKRWALASPACGTNSGSGSNRPCQGFSSTVTAVRACRTRSTCAFRAPPETQILEGAPEVAASTGSACHAGGESASAVILAMGVAPDDAVGSIRLTLGRGTTPADIVTAAAALARSWRAVRTDGHCAGE